VIIRGLVPQVDGGRHRIKRTPGEVVHVEADLFADGHDKITGVVQHRAKGAKDWQEVPLAFLINDRWAADFLVGDPGIWEYRVVGWVDRFTTWREALRKKADAGVDVPSHLRAGAALLKDLAGRRRTADAKAVRDAANLIGDKGAEEGVRVEAGLDDELAAHVAAIDPRAHLTTTAAFEIQVDRERARFSAWYELFPRSLGAPDRHGTLQDVIDHLPYVAILGFDVLYLPPIHPIGAAHRKGKNNSTIAEPDDVGSPWAIGGPDGGHTAVHPDLGTIEDLEKLVTVARDDYEIDVALDIAFQCSPDHPWVKEHPEWFKHRPDGSIQYAENPPKKYEDIYPLDFESSDADGLWQALHDVFAFWLDRGVKIFRVDNPHTKSLRFWEWVIEKLRAKDPDVIFLSEAFTRPRVMEELAKRGFTQSYTYFTWRVHKWEIEEYVRYLFHSDVIDYFRPNFWPNTPDILPEHLQHGGRPAFIQRLVLAAMLSSNWGCYGPAFELLEHEPRQFGSEEYLDSEKYQLRDWDLTDKRSLAPLIATVNQIRADHVCLQSNHNVTLHTVDNDLLVAWSKTTDDGSDVVLTIVNLDPHHVQSGTVHLDMGGLRLHWDDSFEVHDLLTDTRFQWHGSHNYVELPPELPAHVFHVRAHHPTEQDSPLFA
jgi:starch synthase (maltosyl-transferring)